MRVIINADDCGKNEIVNAKIEECIKAGRLTSTTVMANWEDLDGAKRLYDLYKDKISFGCHITLDEGKPILYNQVLAETHFIEKRDGEWYFTRELWKRKFITGELKKAILVECFAQVDRLLECGFGLSHFDSHHHVHTAKGLIWLMPILCNKYNIKKYRRMRNCVPSGIGFYLRQTWNMLQQMQMHNCTTTERFDSYSGVLANLNTVKGAKSLEIMCHPGHPGEQFKEEVDKLLSSEHIVSGNNIDLINYNQL